MSAPDLPSKLKQVLATRSIREHHAIWHLVRSRWGQLSDTRRKFYASLGWKPPRFLGHCLSGIDFLGMHREMIVKVKKFVQSHGSGIGQVGGWQTIPWDHDDADWPMPKNYPSNPDPLSKLQFITGNYRREAEDRYLNNAWLKGICIDKMGILIESGIHAWMHMHWSADPWYKPYTGKDIDDVRNDYLGSFYSSHVNKHFWKLHGWIDDRITTWETANGTAADLSQAWAGPMHWEDNTSHPRIMTDEEIMLVGAQLR